MYENLQSLRVIERKLAPLLAIFSSHRNVLSKLFQINSNLLRSAVVSKQQFDANIGIIESMHESTSAYERETEHMLGRVRSTSQLISDTIALKSQNTSQIMSNQMLRDSGTIRVITLVTLVYLPATFVAVSLHKKCVTSSVNADNPRDFLVLDSFP
jgi:Mg2+ and Co2+ transporter CorA